MRVRDKKIWSAVGEDLVRIGMIFLLSVIAILMLIAIFYGNPANEAPVGSFSTEDFNKGWILSDNSGEREVSLPTDLDSELGQQVIIRNNLPDNIEDGMSLMIRSNMEDVIIVVDGQIRAQYASGSIPHMSYYIPSAYVVAELNAEDAGKEIEIQVCPKARAVINPVTIGNGNNVWFDVLKRGITVNYIAIVVLILGLMLGAGTLFLKRNFQVSAPRYLSLLMISIALWILSESTLRQFLFKSASLSQYFAYFAVELIGGCACMFFDEVQHRVYHKRYVIAEAVVLVQILVNAILHATGIVELYQSMMVSHIWTGICAIVAIINIVTDIYTGRIKKYKLTSVGMICFVVMSLSELLAFYVNPFHTFGGLLCIALIMLMFATVSQTIHDAALAQATREKEQTMMTIRTIETIAGAIDARDEYTGGHSERVGRYAERLAREMAADYDLTEEDIMRVRYIGLVHDIGKIGVADSVLNKSGKLTDDEFSLMKKHAEIGYEIMSAMGENNKSLLDGIRYHHERFDGKGYPDGLSDTDIPLIARILSLADCYDAMTSNRVYRKRLSEEEVRAELLRCSGTQFDPALTEIFVRLIDRNELRADTVAGMATNLSGKVTAASFLETRLQKDLLEKADVTNPSHIRMVCYIIKLMEKKGTDYQLFLAGPKESWDEEKQSEFWNEYRDFMRGYIGAGDMNIRYTSLHNIVALYGKTEQEAEELISILKQKFPDIEIEILRWEEG